MARHWAYDWLGLPLPDRQGNAKQPRLLRVASVAIMVAESREHPGPELAPGYRAFDFSRDASLAIARSLRSLRYRVAVFEKDRRAICQCDGESNLPRCALYGAVTRATVRKCRASDFALEIALAQSDESEGGLACITSGSETAFRFSRIFLDLLEITTGLSRQREALVSYAPNPLQCTPVDLIFAERANPHAVTCELSPPPGQSLSDWYGEGTILERVSNAAISAIRETIQPQQWVN